MSRRLVFILLGVLGVGVIGGAIVFAVNTFRESRDKATQEHAGGLPEAETGGQRVADPTGDDDNDGLTNADEKLWGTNPSNPDTDSDGTKDGQEVASHRNPTIRGPRDTLPEGFVPGRDTTPLQEAELTSIPFDQLFVENLDVSGGDKNLTEMYRSQTPKNERSSETVVSFVTSQPIITKLPTPAEKTIQLAKKNTATGIASYLSIVENTTSLSNKALLADAQHDLFLEKDSSGFMSLSAQTQSFQRQLVEQTIPPAAESLHRILIGYTELLSSTFNQIAGYANDPVKSLVGIRQLEAIDKKYYPMIQQEISRLRSLQTQL